MNTSWNSQTSRNNTCFAMDLSLLHTARADALARMHAAQRALAHATQAFEAADAAYVTGVEAQRATLSFAGLAGQAKYATLSYDYAEWDHDTTYLLPYYIQQKLGARDQLKLCHVVATEEGFALTLGELSTREAKADGSLGKEVVHRTFTFEALQTLLDSARAWENAIASGANRTEASPRKRANAPTVDLSTISLDCL